MPTIKRNVVSDCRPGRLFKISSLTRGCVPLGSDSPEPRDSIPILSVNFGSSFRNTRTFNIGVGGFIPPDSVYQEIRGRISKRYHSETGDWGVLDNPCNALNHEVCRRTSDLARQSLFPLSLISSPVGTVNGETEMEMVVSSPLRLPAESGWR